MQYKESVQSCWVQSRFTAKHRVCIYWLCRLQKLSLVVSLKANRTSEGLQPRPAKLTGRNGAGSQPVKQLSQLSRGGSFATAGDQPVVAQLSAARFAVLLLFCLLSVFVHQRLAIQQVPAHFFQIHHSEVRKKERMGFFFSSKKINSSNSRKVCFRISNLIYYISSFAHSDESTIWQMTSCRPWFYLHFSTALDNPFFFLLCPR